MISHDKPSWVLKKSKKDLKINPCCSRLSPGVGYLTPYRNGYAIPLCTSMIECSLKFKIRMHQQGPYPTGHGFWRMLFGSLGTLALRQRQYISAYLSISQHPGPNLFSVSMTSSSMFGRHHLMTRASPMMTKCQEHTKNMHEHPLWKQVSNGYLSLLYPSLLQVTCSSASSTRLFGFDGVDLSCGCPISCKIGVRYWGCLRSISL